MANIDSEAFFNARMLAVGLSATEATAIRAKGWLTLAIFAFASSWVPGQQDERPFVDKVIIPILADADHASAPKLRRLMFEAYTLSVADLRAKLNRTSDDPPIRMSQPERNSRMVKLRNRLPGLSIIEGLEPSHKLVDVFVQMAEDDSIEYVPWEELTERQQEIHGISKDKEVTDVVFKPDRLGFVKSSVVNDNHASADLTSDLKLKQALTRRGIAMDLAGLCGYEQHQLLVEMFLREYLRPPIEDHRPTSLEQIKRADRHVFTRLAEHTMSGIRPHAGMDPPIEAALKLIMLEPALSYLLMQGQSSRSSGKGGKTEDPTDKAARKRKHEEGIAAAKAAKAARLATKGSKPASSSTAPTSGKGNRKGGNLPQALIGKQAIGADGRRRCYSYNMGGCALAADGAECSKGWHLCMEIGCDKPHSCKNH